LSLRALCLPVRLVHDAKRSTELTPRSIPRSLYAMGNKNMLILLEPDRWQRSPSMILGLKPRNFIPRDDGEGEALLLKFDIKRTYGGLAVEAGSFYDDTY
jgi:hypothetical protein